MVSKTLFSSNTGEWGTPPEIYNPLNDIYHFETDPCTTKDNPLKTKWFYTKEQNGLEQLWQGNTFINPPYGKDIGFWVNEAIKRHTRYYDYYNQRHVGTIVMLLPARTDTKWFHQYLYNESSMQSRWHIKIRFLKGRIKFVGAKHPAPFPSMLVIMEDNRI